ncbi:MAG: CHASE2 domain-containing protein, partial [Zoogloea sp.]|uniref:CHASE2 domain-containing protein n=1 Tax=Zoogloea sp. TaxID=49181 RepID=UPI003F2B7DDD
MKGEQAQPGLGQRLAAWVAPGVRRLGARAYLLLALIFTLGIWSGLGPFKLVAATEGKLFDMLMAQRLKVPAPDPEIVIIDIDEASLAAMAPTHGRWPWPNQVFGELLRGLEAQQPRAVVFDILFADPDTLRPASDAAFNAVVAGSSHSFFPMLRLDPRNDRLSRIPAGALPGVRPLGGEAEADAEATVAMILPKVPAALDNGRLGTHQVEPDKDGVIRRYPGWLAHAGWRIPSLAQRVVEEAGLPGAEQQDVLLNWRGPPFTYPYVSFIEVYRALQHPEQALPGGGFRDKIVIIGSTAPSLFDIKASPMARIHPGVEILATAIDNLRHQDYLREQPRWAMVLLALVLVWSMAYALYRQVRIEVFDTVFGVLQGGLLAVSYAVLNLSPWYLDASAPLSIGLSFFTLARVYYGQSMRWLADSQVQSIAELAAGERHLAVLALRLPGVDARERRRLKGEIDHLVARSSLGACRIVHLVEDPGFINTVFQDTMLVYWLLEDPAAPWQAEAAQLVADLGSSPPGQRGQWARRLRVAQEAQSLGWTR